MADVVSQSGGALGVRPLTVDDAAVMAVVLADPSLYRCTGGDVAEIAWVIGRRWQCRGFANRAVGLSISDLSGRGVHRVIAHLHPDHQASRRVAEAAGLSATDDLVDGEVRWVGAIR